MTSSPEAIVADYFQTLAADPSVSERLIGKQLAAAGHVPADTVLVGAAVTVGVYALVGRAFCGWVCPVNPVSDLAAWTRRRLGLRGKLLLSRDLRFGALGLTLVLSAISGVAAFEWLSPIGLTTRALLSGATVGLISLVGVFALDLFAGEAAFCGHLCPLGATYALVGARPALRIRFHAERCTHCMACHEVCPESPVLRPLLDTRRPAAYVADGACLNCARCIEVCPDDALSLGLRLPGAGPKRRTAT